MVLKVKAVNHFKPSVLNYNGKGLWCGQNWDWCFSPGLTDGNKCNGGPKYLVSYVEHLWEGKSVMKSNREINCGWETLTTGFRFVFKANWSFETSPENVINIYIRCKINQWWQVVWQPKRGSWSEEAGKSLNVKGKLRHTEGYIFNIDKRKKTKQK